jgi:hypothetical protein
MEGGAGVAESSMHDTAAAVLNAAAMQAVLDEVPAVPPPTVVVVGAVGSAAVTADDEALPSPPLVVLEAVAAPLTPAPAPASAPAATSVEAGYAALFRSAKPTNGLLSAKEAGALLKTSGLASSALRSVWGDAKIAGPKACPKGQMDCSEFLIACELAVTAGGVFPDGVSSTLAPETVAENQLDNSEC